MCCERDSDYLTLLYNQIVSHGLVVRCKMPISSPPPTLNGRYWIFTARKRSLGQGNIFRSVCQEFCPQGGGRGACMVAGGHAWLQGGLHGCRGACMVAGGPAWLLEGLRGCWGCVVVGRHAWLLGACLVVGGMPGCRGWGGALDTTRYGQWAGGTHPTGMQSCLWKFMGFQKNPVNVP